MECLRHGLPSFGFERGCYSCLKVRGLAGGTLTSDEEAFAGLTPAPPPTGGWHNPDAIPELTAFYDPATDDVYMTDAERTLLQMLADPPAQTGRPVEVG